MVTHLQTNQQALMGLIEASYHQSCVYVLVRHVLAENLQKLLKPILIEYISTRFENCVYSLIDLHPFLK